jgi:DNA primase catalytic core
MARIPESEVERLKREVSLVRVIEGAGLCLVKQGKDLACRCPFHEGDDTPSLIVTPASNLWHCFGCDAGGSVIDWVMRFHKVSFRHACELLAQDHPALASGSGKPPPAAEVRRVQSFGLDAGDQALLDQVLGFYHDTLKQSAEALAYLDKRGLHDPALIERFRLGYANRTLAYRLPPKQVKAGAEQRGALQRIGILRDSGHEHFNGSLVIPILDADGHATEVYGRKIRDDLRPGTPLHLYLPGPHRGVFNRAGIEGQDEVILCEALIDALTFIAAGYDHVTSAFGVTGVTDELLEALKTCGAKRVLIAFDRDEAGERAAAELAPRLLALGLDAYRLLFPKGMDANAYASQVKPARKSLGVVIRSAVWMGQGAAPARPAPIEPIPAADPVLDVLPPNLPSLVAEATVPEAAADDTVPALPARAVGATPEPDIAAETTERDTLVTFGERRYRVRGLAKNTSPEVLKVNVLVSSGEALHVDTLDLYQAKARQVFARQAAVELVCEDSVIQRDLGKLLLKCEELQDQRLRAALSPKEAGPAQMAQADEAAALAFLKSPDLIERITADFERCGLVGEPVNALVGYLAAVSRKLAGPLAIIIQSTSAAGKSALMDAVLKLVPEEDRVHYSAMTGQSLFYIGEKDLKHKILAIAEEEGVRQAAYALKLLQSQGELTIATHGERPGDRQAGDGGIPGRRPGDAVSDDHRDRYRRGAAQPLPGADHQRERVSRRARSRPASAAHARSPVCSRRTRRRRCAALHRNAQRLLKPLAVVNPFAEALTFLDERTRTRQRSPEVPDADRQHRAAAPAPARGEDRRAWRAEPRLPRSHGGRHCLGQPPGA